MQPEDIFKKFAESKQGHALRMAQEALEPVKITKGYRIEKVKATEPEEVTNQLLKLRKETSPKQEEPSSLSEQ